MARDFDGTSDKIVSATKSYFNFLHSATYVGTVSIWIKHDIGEPDEIYWYFNNAFNSTTIGFHVFMDDRSSISRSRRIGGGITNGSSTVLSYLSSDNFFPNSTDWELLTVRVDQSEATQNAKVTLNDDVAGQLTATDSGTGTSSDATYDGIMGVKSNVTGDFMDGKLANVCIWQEQLSDNHIKAISRGVNPFSLFTGNQKAFFPLHGNESPESQYVGQVNKGTLTGTSKATTNPPVELLENYL